MRAYPEPEPISPSTQELGSSTTALVVLLLLGPPSLELCFVPSSLHACGSLQHCKDETGSSVDQEPQVLQLKRLICTITPPSLVSPLQKLEPPHRDTNTTHSTNRLIPLGSLHF